MSALQGLSKAVWYPQTFFDHRLASMDQIDRMNAGGGLAVNFRQTGLDPIQVALRGRQSAKLSLWSTHSATGFATAPKFSADILTIRFIRSGQMVRRNRAHALVGCPDQAMLIGFAQMQDAQASPGFSALSATITHEALAAGNDALEGVPGALPDLEPVASAESRPIRALYLSLQNLQRHFVSEQFEEDLFSPLLEEILTYQFLSAWPRTSPVRADPRDPLHSRQLRRAMDYIVGHLDAPLRLADVAKAAGVSVRSLQILFKKELQQTPLQFILERRLRSAHDDLRSAEALGLSVGEVARRWGFTHMSEFGRRYRDRYGCVPSQTWRHGAR